MGSNSPPRRRACSLLDRSKVSRSRRKSTSLMFVPNRDVATSAKGSCFQSASSRQTMNPSPCRRGSFSYRRDMMQTPSVALHVGVDVGKDEIVVACAEGSVAARRVHHQRAALLAWLKEL